MHYVYVGRNELVALVVGLVTGTLYSWLNLPIPAPNVLGGIFAIIFTYLGYLIVNAWRRSVTFGRPPAPGLSDADASRSPRSASQS